MTAWGSFGAADGQFNQTAGIVEDALGFIYVSDYRNQRIQKFQLPMATAMAAAKIVYAPLPTGAQRRGSRGSNPEGAGGATRQAMTSRPSM